MVFRNTNLSSQQIFRKSRDYVDIKNMEIGPFTLFLKFFKQFIDAIILRDNSDRKERIRTHSKLYLTLNL